VHTDGGFHRLRDEEVFALFELGAQRLLFGCQAGGSTCTLGGHGLDEAPVFVFQGCFQGDVTVLLFVGCAGGVGESSSFLTGVGEPVMDEEQRYDRERDHGQAEAAEGLRGVTTGYGMDGD